MVQTDCPLLASREFVRDLAIIAEQLVMDDMPVWAYPEQAKSANAPATTEAKEAILEGDLCREQKNALFPDKVGDMQSRASDDCFVRQSRARWATELQKKYGLRVLQWIDSAEGLEKQCAILLLPRGCPGDERPVLVVAFRGSKSAKDYARTDVSPFLVPTPWATRASTPGRSLDAEEDNDADVDDKAARLMPLLAKSDLPCTTLGLWRAYAGTSSRCRLGLGPRGRVRRAVESALVLHPSARLCVTGHSLGGSLAILCALDLLLTSPMVYSANLTLVAFAAPRFFNAATQKVASRLHADGRLNPLRVACAGDLLCTLPPKIVGGVPGVRPRLVLHPAAPRRTREQSEGSGSEPSLSREPSAAEEDAVVAAEDSVTSNADSGGVDEGATCQMSLFPDLDDDVNLRPRIDPHAHNSHALFLAGETTPTGARSTIAWEHPWPLQLKERERMLPFDVSDAAAVGDATVGALKRVGSGALERVGSVGRSLTDLLGVTAPADEDPIRSARGFVKNAETGEWEEEPP